MDSRLLEYYNRELQHLREMGGEFARQYPKIAGRLGLDGFECADPYVERLLEGFGFLAARVQLKVDAEFPRFTQHLMEVVYPHFLAPTPSMMVVGFEPDLMEGSLVDGYVVPRDTALRSLLGKGDQTPCEYRTAHDVTLWPLLMAEAEYLPTAGDVAALGIQVSSQVRAGLRLRIRMAGELTLDQLALNELTVFLRGSGALPMRLYEQVFGHAMELVVQSADRPAAWQERINKSCIRQIGFEDQQALLPYGPRSFQGYRLLHEYFAFPDRFMFFRLEQLRRAIARCNAREVDIIFLFDSGDVALEHAVDESHFELFCTPAINLFPKRADRIHLNNQTSDHHVVPDRTRPMDFETYQVTEVVGHGTSADSEQEFKSFYAIEDASSAGERAYYTVQRSPRLLSGKQRRQGPRSSYVGSETFVTLVDGNDAPYRSDLRQLSINTLCTNRDLPIHMPLGKGETDFTMESGAPVNAVKRVAGPSRPEQSSAMGETAWRAISHLSLNYLSLVDSSERQGAAALRELLTLYADFSEAHVRKQVEGIRSVSSEPIVRRIPVEGRMTVGRGLQITVSFNESAFEGTGVFLLGAVLEEFFARYVSINSFTETVIKTEDRGVVMRWPARIGRRHTA